MAGLNYKYIADLVSDAQQGNSNAFAELYAATYQKEYAYAYQCLKDAHLAQDALQETYILAFKNLGTLKDSLTFISWLNQICFRVCFNMQRKQNRHPEEPLDPELSNAHSLDSPQHTPEEHYIMIEHQHYITHQVMSLPPLESEAIILRYYHNLKVDDVASLMNVSKSTAKRYISNGLRQLKETLTKE